MSFTPTRDQEIALEKIRDFLKPTNNERVFVLLGAAGVGKTSVLSVITHELYILGKRVCGGAFTNKATNVLAKKNPYISKLTLFKMLNLRADETSENLSFRKTSKDKISSEVSYFDVIILDEISQVLDEHLKDLIKEVELYKKKLILVGDRFQLPPIGQEKDSFAFSLPNKYELTEIVRQAETSDIPLYAGQIREILDRISAGEKIRITQKLSGVFLKEGSDVILTQNGSEFLQNFLEDFKSDQYKTDNDYVKVIAYRNVTINKINELIRKELFEDAESPIVEGDRLILNNPGYEYNNFDENNVSIYETSEELNVIRIVNRSIYDQIKLGVRIQFPYCLCDVVEKESKIEGKLNFIYPGFKDKFEQQMKDWAKEINKLDKYERKKVFKEEFYPFKKRFNIPSYAYALTSHKGQGSTYKRVYVVEDDIEKVPADAKTLWSSKYVAITRASEKVVILNRNP